VEIGELPTVRTRPFISGLLIIASLGWVFSVAGCGSEDSQQDGRGTKSSSDQELEPHEPSSPGSGRDYGIARDWRSREAAPAYDRGYPSASQSHRPYGGDYAPYPPVQPGDRDLWTREPSFRGRSGDYDVTSDPRSRGRSPYEPGYPRSYPSYGAERGGYAPYPEPRSSQAPSEEYSFRPLSRREKERMQAQSAPSYHQRPRTEYDYGLRAPMPPQTAPMYPEVEREGYSYWPLPPQPAPGNAPQGPSWGPNQEHVDQWGTGPGYPYSLPRRRWPPAERMLPNLDDGSTRTFAAN
jgi:hypothetical protein